jgi:hypothetical protein
MKQLTLNLKQDSEATGEMKTSSSQVVSLANHIQSRDTEKEKKMTATSGQKCLEQFEKFNRATLWAKTFADLLIGMGDWYSMKCKLTWKLKATKCYRFYFQLVPSTHHTEETEYGLLPTPLAQAREQTNFKAYDQRMERLVEKGHKPFTMPLDQMALRGLLPTPTAMDSTNATANMKSTQVKEGSMHSVTLTRAMAMGMLPTPQASECEKITGLENQNSMKKVIRKITGQTSQLSPQFVMEMMGFPTDWTELPFLNGGMNQSKPEETQ